MIGKTLQDILDEKGTNANELSKMIGVSCQTIYSIIKRDNMKIDFEVLLKICKALNVSVERFYSDYCDYSEAAYLLSPHEKELVSAYREHPDMQKSVNLLLGINSDNFSTERLTAARKEEGGGVEIRTMNDSEKEAVINKTFGEGF